MEQALRDDALVRQMKNGMASTAEQLYTSSFAMKRRMYGADVDHQSLSGSMHAQAKLSREIGKLDEANEQCKISIAMKKRLHGDVDHPDISTSIYEQGKIAMDKGNLVEARNLFNHCLTIQRRLSGYDNGHLHMSYVLYDLGLIYIQSKLFKDAEQVFSECLSIKKRVYGENTTHSEIADCLEKLGLVMRYKIYMSSLKTTNDSHCVDASTTIYEEGRIALRMGDFAEAKKLLEDCLTIQRKFIGYEEGYLRMSYVMYGLGLAYMELKTFEEAEKVLSECLEVKERVHGKNSTHSKIVACFEKLGLAMRYKGYISSLETRNYLHSSRAVIINYEEGRTTLRRGDLAKARKHLEECFLLHQEFVGYRSKSYVMYDLGLAYIELKLFKEAGSVLSECLMIKNRAYGESATHSDIADCLASLALVMRHEGYLQISEEYYRTARDMYRVMSRKELLHGLQDFEKNNFVDAKGHFINCIRMNLNMHRQLLDETNNEEFQSCISRMTVPCKKWSSSDLDLIYISQEYQKSHSSACIQNFLNKQRCTNELLVLKHLKNLGALILDHPKPKEGLELEVGTDNFDSKVTGKILKDLHPLLRKASNPELSLCLGCLSKVDDGQAFHGRTSRGHRDFLWSLELHFVTLESELLRKVLSDSGKSSFTSSVLTVT